MDKELLIDQYLQGKHPIDGESWELPTADELERDEALYDALLAERKAPKRRTLPMALRWLTTGIAACIALLLGFSLLMKDGETDTEQPVVAETIGKGTTPQLAPQPPADEKKAEPQKANKPYKTYKTYKTHKTHKTYKSYKTQKSYKPPVPEALAEVKPSPSVEKPEEDVCTIPPDKQALADIFLAEEALQVAFELRAQQEAIRAYAASLTGRELPKPIIAF